MNDGKNPTRREFTKQVALMTLGVIGFGTSSDGSVAVSAESSDNDGRIRCEWTEDDGTHVLWIGKKNDVATLGMFYGATVFGSLFQSDDNNWTYRFGRQFIYIEGKQLAEAKRLAEMQTVEWIRQLLVEVERFAFRLNREKNLE